MLLLTFISCFKKIYGDEYHYKQPKKLKLERLSKKEELLVTPWLDPNAAVQLWKQGSLIFAVPTVLEKDLLCIVSADLYIRKAGVAIGSLAGTDLIPDHALALSQLVNPGVPVISLNKEEALQYLRKEEVKISSTLKGWALVQYEGMNLGWIKLLANRTNNYYPKEWRILKSGNQ